MRMFIFVLLASMTCEMARAAQPPEWIASSPLKVEWIWRPWEYRYLLHVASESQSRRYRELHQEAVRKDPIKAIEHGLDFAVAFDPQWTLVPKVPQGYYGTLKSLHIVRLDMAKERSVLQRPLTGEPLTARLNGYGGIVLTPAETNPPYVINFAEFFMGSPEAADPRYSPSMCSTLHGDTVPPGENGRYGLKSKNEIWSLDGFFGCREWAAQLYDSNRPYIDVTSYEMRENLDAKPDKRGKYPLKPVSYIKPFVGFARFNDPIKPVIGKYGETWYCITDCPAGDAPGEIADIKAWAARSGWSVPQRPKNPRAFINKRIKPSEFVD